MVRTHPPGCSGCRNSRRHSERQLLWRSPGLGRKRVYLSPHTPNINRNHCCSGANVARRRYMTAANASLPPGDNALEDRQRTSLGLPNHGLCGVCQAHGRKHLFVCQNHARSDPEPGIPVQIGWALAANGSSRPSQAAWAVTRLFKCAPNSRELTLRENRKRAAPHKPEDLSLSV